MPPLLQKKRLLSPSLSIPPLLERARRQTAPLQYALLKRMGSEGGGEKYLPCSTAVVHAEKPFSSCSGFTVLARSLCCSVTVFRGWHTVHFPGGSVKVPLPPLHAKPGKASITS